MTNANQLLPNWRINVVEVSTGVYKVVAVHAAGPTIEIVGTDENKLIEDAQIAAREMERTIRARQMKRLIFEAEPLDYFKPQDEWVVMAHNLDDAGDAEQVGGPFASRTEAEAEAQRLERSRQPNSR